jgi:hypothetical protein
VLYCMALLLFGMGEIGCVRALWCLAMCSLYIFLPSSIHLSISLPSDTSTGKMQQKHCSRDAIAEGTRTSLKNQNPCTKGSQNPRA